jgi:preprotein translocase subunit SecY
LGNYSKCKFSIYLKQILFDWNYALAFEIVVWLTTGAMIVLWLSELITDYGLGNGASLLIYTNIISSLPNLTKTIFLENSENLTICFRNWNYFFNFASLYGIVFLQEGVRIIPLISSKQLNQSSLQDSITSNNYIPLRFNQAGVMPIILTTAILVVPNYISNLGLLPKIDLPKIWNLLNFLLDWLFWINFNI